MLIDRIPIRVRITFAHTVLMAIVFALIGYGLLKAVKLNLYNSVDNALMASAKTIRDYHFAINNVQENTLKEILHQMSDENLIFSFAQLVDLNGKINTQRSKKISLPVSPNAMQRAIIKTYTYETLLDARKKPSIRVLTLPVVRKNKFTGQLIQIGTRLASTRMLIKELAIVLWTILPAGLLLSLILGYFLTSKAFKPVVNLTKAAESLGSKDLSIRLALPHANDEVSKLTLTFNNMLDRLDDAFSRLRKFNSNVSHELRTPLAVLKAEAELALRKERKSDEYKMALKKILLESVHMNKIIEDLLLLAKAENFSLKFTKENISSKEFMQQLKDQCQTILAEKKLFINIVASEDFNLYIHIGYLTLAIKNILANAIKHSKQNDVINFTVIKEQSKIIFKIQDYGTGISAQDQKHIFDPFFRADNVRNRAMSGTGVGLSLAKALIKLHSGTLEVKSELGAGSTFSITLNSNSNTLT